MREPAVAGMFYPRDRKELDTLVTKFLAPTQPRYKALAGVAPHAGYEYSGATAAWTYANLAPKQTIVVIGPDHTGSSLGDTCIYSDGAWKTPLGNVGVDRALAEELRSVGVANNGAHNGEHSVEVQLPFIQKKFPGAKILPIMMGDQNKDVAIALGEALAGQECAVVASSDFSHYVPVDKAEEDDNYCIAALKKLDVEGFYERAMDRQLSACGIGPIAAAAAFAKKKGAKAGILLHYSTSADVTGDDECVGYASIVFV